MENFDEINNEDSFESLLNFSNKDFSNCISSVFLSYKLLISPPGYSSIARHKKSIAQVVLNYYKPNIFF